MAEYLFPKGFLWGVATSAYQIEGAFKEDGRGPSIWDTFSHAPGKVLNGDTGDVACDHYHRYKEDVKLMRKLGIDAYRFSVAWPRVFPEGKGRLNQKGLDFYSRLVDELLENGIVPVITIYHWDLPQALQDEGGWENREIVEHFENYARVLFRELGDRVKYWITMCEIWSVMFSGYYLAAYAPGLGGGIKMALSVAHNMLLSHARALKIFREEVRDGTIGITNLMMPSYPSSEDPEDLRAAQLADQFANGWFHLPLAKGEYPKEAVQVYEAMGVMPDVEPGDMKLIGAPIDFWGVNYYTRNLVKADPEAEFGFGLAPPSLETTEMGWEIYPQGLYDSLMKVKKDYKDIPILITENGMADVDTVKNGRIHDVRRIGYLKEQIKSVHKALKDGVDVRGYFLWSLMDNFEWIYGYSKRFGIIYVDYDTQQRIPKDSANWYSGVIEKNGLID